MRMILSINVGEGQLNAFDFVYNDKYDAKTNIVTFLGVGMTKTNILTNILTFLILFKTCDLSDI